MVCRPPSRAPWGPRGSRPAGFLLEPQVRDGGMRVSFFIDGFNLYHSLVETERRQPGLKIKWLDPIKLARHCLPSLGKDAVLVSIDHFTAIPEHLQVRDPDKLARHRIYIRALESLDNPNVGLHLGRIRREPTSPKNSHTWREKGTDVGLACALWEKAMGDVFDVGVIVSGDTDYLPLPIAIHRSFADKRVVFAFPYLRAPTSLIAASPGSLILSPEIYGASLLDNPLRLPNGRVLHAPSSW